MSRTIEVSEMVTMVAIVAELVKTGLTFRVQERSAYWVIELLGGY